MAELELGNMLFNNSNDNQVYDCPRWVVALLADINNEISRKYWNENQKVWDSAFANTGNEYIGKCFEVHAYNWDEDDFLPCNFSCDGVRISWYKHVRRNPTININPKSKTFAKIILDMYDKVMNELTGDESKDV